MTWKGVLVTADVKRWNVVMRYWGFFLSSLLLSVSVHAETCPEWVAKVISIQGTVELRETNSTTGKRWTEVKRGYTFCAKDIVRVKNNSRAAVILTNDTILRLDQNSTITFANISPTSASTINLSKGIAHFISRVKQAFEVVTPFVNAAVEGTEFVVAVNEIQSQVTVFEGSVRVSNLQGEVLLTQNQSASALKGQAPILKTTVKPRDAVQWALYYPIIVDQYSVSASTKKEIISAASQLAAGRVIQALKSINKVLATSPEQPEALALKAIITLVSNDKAQALTLATQALESDSQNICALLAMSYVQQAHFDIQAALNTLTQKPISNALVYARLSELYLMLGQLDDALEKAKKAVALNDKLSKTQSILGFAYLTQINVKQAEAAFNKAIELDQTEPLARLGLGLALIRQGQLEQGRREIEYAASLDPNNALIRSYLGKAYYEENRNKVATSQFDMAKELDPKDPTAWFYSAIQKQSNNRPVEALQDLQTSTQLNDNRAVYRSQLLLDGDNAARSASLGRIYSDLGFEQLALQQAYSSLNQDPTNYSAHRLLADAYASQPRHEIARVSELLQAQLLQSINAAPLQPHLAESTLAIVGNAGPSQLSFNEFNPLFTKDGLFFQANGLIGNNNTEGNDVAIAGIKDNFSFSLGQYHYETDGFRTNNDLNEDVVNVFAQYAVTPKFSLQAEWRRHDSDHGDIDTNFDPADFSSSNRRVVRQDTARVGGHYKATVNSDILFSYIEADRKGQQLFKGLPSEPIIDENIKVDAKQSEVQYLYKQSNYNLTTGLSSYRNKRSETTIFDWTTVFGSMCPPSPPFPPVPCETQSDVTRDHDTAYLYANFKTDKDMNWDVGLSYDDLDERFLHINELNPKLGLNWSLSQKTTLRFAYVETLQRSLATQQTIEPTSIAGFNQFFDDLIGTKVKQYGLGLDINLTSKVSTGLEITRRDLDIPQFETGPDSVIFNARQEDYSSAHINWSPDLNWTLTAKYQQYKIENETGLGPLKLDSTSFPLTLRYLQPNGIFSELTATHVKQKVKLQTTSNFAQTRENFTLVDLSIGYRLPKRIGKISLEINNLFDEKFIYQDLNFTRTEAVNPRYFPERQVMGRITLSF